MDFLRSKSITEVGGAERNVEPSPGCLGDRTSSARAQRSVSTEPSPARQALASALIRRYRWEASVSAMGRVVGRLAHTAGAVGGLWRSGRPT